MSWETWHLMSYRLVIVVIKYDHIHIWYIYIYAYIHIYMWCSFYCSLQFWLKNLFPSPSVPCCLCKLHFSMESRLGKPPETFGVPRGVPAMIGLLLLVWQIHTLWFMMFMSMLRNTSARQKHLFGLLVFWKVLKNEHPDWGPIKSIHNGFSFVLLNQGFRDFDPGIAMWLEATDGRNPANQLRLVVYHPSLLFTGFCFLHPRWCRIS